jgi:hypothetical protein
MISAVYISVLNRFRLTSAPSKVEKWGEGHIHATYLVSTAHHNPDYILQKINRNIFRDIPGMMGNIEAVTRHIRDKLENIPGHNPGIESLTLVYTRNGGSYFEDEDKNCWRMFNFIPDTVIYQKMDDPALAFEAGKSIGFFQSMLADLKSPLVETIPDFHNINSRITQYLEARTGDPLNRAATILNEIHFAEQRFDWMRNYYSKLIEKASVRTTHNDTKLNNILFDKNNRALCLIDLDTVMPGYVHFDFGDAMRTMANTALEDEKDLSKVMFNKKVYDSFSKGYLETIGNIMSDKEKHLLTYSPIYMTFIIGLRFLTDYLNGDIYFHVNHPLHNLERARVQFKLVNEMEKYLIL